MTDAAAGRRRRSYRALDVRDVTVRFGSLRVLEDVTLEVPQGGFYGLIGPNGAGKTTLFNVISGFVKPAQGRVRIEGRRVGDLSPAHRARIGLGRTFQGVGLDKFATVEENLVVAQRVGSLRLELLAFAGLDRRGDAAEAEARDEMCELLDIDALRSRPVSELPMGAAKLVEFATVLLRRPRLLLLDELSSGVGPDETARLADVLRRVHVEQGVTILMIEHDMRLAMSTAEYLYVLQFGRVLAAGEPAEIQQNAEVVEAYLGRGVA